MRLLIITQAVDARDPVLGFFIRWIEEFGKRAEQIEVICLTEGEHSLPASIPVHSLGKEQLEIGNWKLKIWARIRYGLRFLKLIWKLRNQYDSVFVHMNQEYVLLGGLLWRLLSKKIFLWRNHKQGNLPTDLAVLLSHRTFSTSPESYIAHYKKTSLMPVGVDTDLFRRKPELEKTPRSVLFLGRISPVKNVNLLIRALSALKERGERFSALVVGDPPPRDSGYASGIEQTVRELALENEVTFEKGVRHEATIDIYNRSEIYVNLTPEGSMDKTIFEAMACETLVLVANRALAGKVDDRCVLADGTSAGLSARLAVLFNLPAKEKKSLGESLREYAVREHSLKKLSEAVTAAMR